MHFFICIQLYRSRQWQPTPVFTPGKSNGRRSLVGCSPWGRWESDITEQLQFQFSLSALEREMATHSRALAWKIPGTEELGRLLSMGSHRVRLGWNDLAAACPLGRWCHPTISSSVIPFFSHLQSFPSIKVFSNESTLRIRWPKYWSFSFSISPSKEYSGLISFRIDWLDLLAVQGTLKSLLQHHSSKASILLCSAFLMVQLSHPYMTARKTIALFD